MHFWKRLYSIIMPIKHDLMEGNFWISILLDIRNWLEINVLTSNFIWLGAPLLDDTPCPDICNLQWNINMLTRIRAWPRSVIAAAWAAAPLQNTALIQESGMLFTRTSEKCITYWLYRVQGHQNKVFLCFFHPAHNLPGTVGLFLQTSMSWLCLDQRRLVELHW